MPQRNSEPQPRKFEYAPAIRKAVPLLIGLNSPSGGGKTFSALRLATGIQRVVGGDIAGIDTEANRMLHYADKFKFHHIPFAPPFSPMDYLDVLEFVVSKGAKTIVLDSASHLHDGPGGILEMHATELERMGGDEKNNFRAWAKPKAQLRQFINAMTTGLGRPDLALNLVFCYRAKEKLKISGKEAEKLGLQPIADPELRFEMTTNILLYNGARGVPTWQSSIRGEMDIIKLPDQFEHMFGIRSQLDEEMGEKMARWSVGGDAPKATLNPDDLKKNEGWISFWNKKGISTERVLATIGKSGVELIDQPDRLRFDDFVKRIKQKEATAEQLFTSTEAPPDDEPIDDEEANRNAAAPTAEEIAALDGKNGKNLPAAGGSA